MIVCAAKTLASAGEFLSAAISDSARIAAGAALAHSARTVEIPTGLPALLFDSIMTLMFITQLFNRFMPTDKYFSRPAITVPVTPTHIRVRHRPEQSHCLFSGATKPSELSTI